MRILNTVLASVITVAIGMAVIFRIPAVRNFITGGR